MRSRSGLGLSPAVRRFVVVLVALAVLTASAGIAAAQTYHFSTLAGLSPIGRADGPAATAQFNLPYGIAYDAAGNLFIADSENHSIRKITPGGVVSTLAGLTGTPGTSNGTGIGARFRVPTGIAIDKSDGTLYVTDLENHTIRKITAAGVVTTFAGMAGVEDVTDGTGSGARFAGPSGIAIDAAKNLYVIDSISYTIRKITPAAVVTTIAGGIDVPGSADGTGTAARIGGRGQAAAHGTMVFFTDSVNHTLRRLDTTTNAVTTIAGAAGTPGNTNATGTAARFRNPDGLGVAADGTIYVSDRDNHIIRKITMPAAVVTTLSGVANTPGFRNGTAAGTRFYNPSGITLNNAGTAVAMTDARTSTIRQVMVADGASSPIAGVAPDTVNGTESAARLAHVRGLTVNAAGTVYVTTEVGRVLQQVTATGVTSVLAGRAGISGVLDGTGTNAGFGNPYDVAIASDGTMYVADQSGHVIRKVTPAGVVTTFAGGTNQSGDANGTGTAARFRFPEGIVVAPNGNIYVTDTSNHTIRAITPAGVVTTLAGSPFQSGTANGTGSAARFFVPRGIAADANALYVADRGNHSIRRVTYDGVVTTLAGVNGTPGSQNGTGATARFSQPSGVATDGNGNLFVADYFNGTIRRIVISTGAVTTVAGSAGVRNVVDAGGAAARFAYPQSITVGKNGTLYVTEADGNTIRVGVPATTNAVTNNSFTSGMTGWGTFAQPNPSAMVSNVTGGVFQFYRDAPAPSTAVVLQETGLTLPGNAPIQATFQLGNSSSVRKRVSVLLHDSNFQDLAVCTFYLPPNSALANYTIRTRTTKRWGNATMSFYAASVGSNGGFYRLDNVTLEYRPEPLQGLTPTTCDDPLAPLPGAGSDGPNLVTNGNFDSGTTGWFLTGSITHQVSGGVFEFIRPTSGPAALIAQTTNQTMTANQILTATFQLGNSSSVRKRVTVLVHDSNFSDLSACTFWLKPNQPLSSYMYRTFAGQAWANAMISVYGATTGTEQWMRLDNVTLQRTPQAVIDGTQCWEADEATDAAAASAARAPVAPRIGGAPAAASEGGNAPADTSWVADGFVESASGGATAWTAEAIDSRRRVLGLAEAVDLREASTARLTLQSWLSSAQSIATIEVSVDDGATWEIVHVVAPSDTWVPIDVDLAAYLGEQVSVRLVFDAVAPASGNAPDIWRIDDVQVIVAP